MQEFFVSEVSVSFTKGLYIENQFMLYQKHFTDFLFLV